MRRRNTMNKGFLIIALLFVSPAIFAQRSMAQREASSESRRVVNEDQGSAYIVTAETQPPLSKVKGVSNFPHQFSVFLGDGWNSDKLRLAEPSLANLFASQIGLSAELSDAIASKNDASVGTFVEVPFNTRDGQVTDLQIQQQIRSVATRDPRPNMGRGTLVMVYLDASLHSRLAELESGKHYLAYENAFNTNGTRIRYVVVPMDANEKRAETVAQTAFLWAIVDP